MHIFYRLNPEEETLFVWEGLPFGIVVLITFAFSSTAGPTAQVTISMFNFQLNNTTHLKEGSVTFLEKTVSFGNDLLAGFMTTNIEVG